MKRIRRALRQMQARTQGFSAAVAVTALLAACSASPSSTGPGGSLNTGGSASSPSALAYSQCMRSHGVPDFPDPPSGGGVPKGSAQQFGVSSSRYQAAYTACQHLLPAGSDDQFPAAEVQQLLIGMREFSQCVRSHGVPNWPDPTTDDQGRPVFPLAPGLYQNRHSPRVQTSIGECQHLLPGALGGGVPFGL